MRDLFQSGDSAVVSACGSYRYRLDRGVGDRFAAFVMVNPSTADAFTDDPTIRKVRGFATRLGYHRFSVGNLFAHRATDVRELRGSVDPVGPDNDAHLARLLAEAELVVVAWGPTAKLPRPLRSRWIEVAGMAVRAGKPLHCLGVAADGQPRHPLMVPYAAVVSEWAAPAA